MPISALVNEVSETLCNTVKDQLISDAPVGCFLSGGLDSSAICYFASTMNENLEFFTTNHHIVDKDQTDDLPYAIKVADHLEVNLSIVEVTADMILECNLLNLKIFLKYAAGNL